MSSTCSGWASAQPASRASAPAPPKNCHPEHRARDPLFAFPPQRRRALVRISDYTLGGGGWDESKSGEGKLMHKGRVPFAVSALGVVVALVLFPYVGSRSGRAVALGQADSPSADVARKEI